MAARTVRPTASSCAFLRSSTQNTVYIADLAAGGTGLLNAHHFTLDESDNYGQTWTNDSKEVVFASNRSGQFGVYKQSLGGSTPQLIANGWFRDLQMSPDGRWFLGIPFPPPANPKDPERLLRIPITGGEAQLVTNISRRAINNCAKLPSTLCVLAERTADGKHLIFTSVDSLKGRGDEVARWDIDPQAGFWFFSLSPDGSRLAVTSSRRGPIHVLSLRGRPEQVIPTRLNNGDEFYWTVDGKRLLVPEDWQGKSMLWNLDLGGNRHLIWQDFGTHLTSGIPSPDGRHVALLTSRSTNNYWMMENF